MPVPVPLPLRLRPPLRFRRGSRGCWRWNCAAACGRRARTSGLSGSTTSARSRSDMPVAPAAVFPKPQFCYYLQYLRARTSPPKKPLQINLQPKSSPGAALSGSVLGELWEALYSQKLLINHKAACSSTTFSNESSILLLSVSTSSDLESILSMLFGSISSCFLVVT